MNKKLIALAVSGALAAPMMAQADDSGPTVYGRLNLAVGVNDSGDSTALDVSDIVSRFGIKGEEDLGNGLAAIYQYEFRTRPDHGIIRANGTAQRLGNAGLKGSFGTAQIGTIWGTWFNLIGTHLDPSYSLGYFGYSGYASGDYRIESVVSYQGSFGPVQLGVDVQLDQGFNVTGTDDGKFGDDTVDRVVVGGKYTTGPISVAVGWDQETREGPDAALGNEVDGGDKTRTGVALAYSGDGFNVNLGWINLDDESTQDSSGQDIDRDWYTINAGFNVNDSNRLLLGYWDGSGDGTDYDSDGFFAGFYHSLSSRTKLYFEGHTGDSGFGDPNQAGGSDADIYLFGLRHDF